jgi:phosphatidylglycerophosphate synthase
MIGRVVVVRGDVSGERVAGLTLLDRTVAAARRAGVARVDLVDAAPPADPDALVLVADRVYEPDAIRRAVADGAPPDGLPAATPAERAAAERALFAKLRKPVDGFISRHLNRRMSLAVTRALLPTGITPNQMTVVASLLGVAGVILVFQATWATLAAGAVLVQAQSVLDGCDGEIARLKLQSSRFGEWFDNVTDDAINASYGVALGCASSVLCVQPLLGWVGVYAAAAIAVYDAVVYAQLIRRHGGTGNPFAFRWWYQTDDRPVAARTTGAAAVVVTLSRRDTFLFAFMLLCLARLPQVALLWYAIVSTGYLAMTIVHAARGGMPVEKAA